MEEEVKKYRLYAGLVQDIPQGVKYSCIPSHHQYLLIYADTPPEQKENFILQDEAVEATLNREEKSWLTACKLEINTQAMREREKEYSSALMDYFDKVEEALKEQKRQKEQETQKDVKQQEAGDNRDTDN